MATNNLIAIPARLVRSVDVGNYTMDGKPTLPVASAGDSITLFTMVHAGRINAATLKVPNTVGAGVTLKLQKNSGGTRTDLTTATTAATAGVVSGTGLLPVDFLAGDTVEILTAGGTNAAVIVEYDVVCRHA